LVFGDIVFFRRFFIRIVSVHGQNVGSVQQRKLVLLRTQPRLKRWIVGRFPVIVAKTGLVKFGNNLRIKSNSACIRDLEFTASRKTS